MHPQSLICVRDVEAGSRWYQRLLGCQSDHGGAQYERLVSNGRLILQLHAWEVEHHHGRIGDPGVTPGNGVLLWFELDDFEAAIARIADLQPQIVQPRHCNPPDGDGGPEPLGSLAARFGRLHRRPRQPGRYSGWELETVAPADE